MNKEKYEEIMDDQCPRVFKDMAEATGLAQKLSGHIDYLLKKVEGLEKVIMNADKILKA